jgi:hypothetical protein
MSTDLLELVRDANPVPADPPAPPIQAVLERLDDPPANRGGRPRPRRRWPRRRGALLVLAGLVIAVPALAQTHPWSPILGHPAFHDTPAGISRTPPPAGQLGLLGVLRRPQNDADRGPIARRMLAEVGSEYKGVRLDSVRLLSSADGQHHALLVPSAEHGLSPKPGRYEVTNGLCIQVGSGTGSGGFCGKTTELRSGNIMGGSADNLLGLVPDGVAKVVLSFPDGQTLSSAITDNFFWVTGVPSEQRTIRAMPLRGHPTPQPQHMTIQEQPKLEWLDTRGNRIGPNGALAK